jgi:hypothetical protein
MEPVSKFFRISRKSATGLQTVVSTPACHSAGYIERYNEEESVKNLFSSDFTAIYPGRNDYLGVAFLRVVLGFPELENFNNKSTFAKENHLWIRA